jgi:hypothetical protein
MQCDPTLPAASRGEGDSERYAIAVPLWMRTGR